ncbi:hypothetical protein CYY_006405 [Polysphondylium violaceum]|uniref:Uncharacterized protein n=1 Tax=Polysphondylium violaceum TaxID=133409 RepID=A0A8J4PQL3_9MYCE|nr:hypothetical protein CYY_006405 [Polysphondylium violaceum]
MTITDSMLTVEKIRDYFEMCNFLVPKYIYLFKNNEQLTITKQIDHFCEEEFVSYEKLLCKILISNKDILKMVRETPSPNICFDGHYLPISVHALF